MDSTDCRVVKGSCWACRKRRIKCDLKQPTCSKCEARNVSCEYGARPLQWVSTSTSTRGRKAVVRHASTSVIPLPPAPAKLTTENLVFYFSNEVLPRLQLGDQLIALDETSVIKDQSLRQAVVAVGRAHHDFLQRPSIPKGDNAWKQARQVALESFRKRLQSGVATTQTAQEVFQTVILFCILDGVISPEDDSEASMQHLMGGISILSNWKEIPAKMLAEGGLHAHLFSVFATMDLVHAMLSGSKPFFEPSTWLKFGDVQAWWGRLAPGNRYLRLMKVYSEMAFMGHMIRPQPKVEESVLTKKWLIHFQDALDDIDESENAPEFATPKQWKTFCNLFRTCGIIYMIRALEGAAIDSDTVQAATRGGVSRLIDEPLPGMLGHCLIFPLLVIGAHCIHTQDRQTIQKALSPSTSFLSFGNLVMMTKFMKEAWSKPDLHHTWWQMFEPVSNKVFLF